jgi:hypothetical protein
MKPDGGVPRQDGADSRSSDLSCSLYTVAERQHFRFVNLTLAARQLGLKSQP